MTPEEIDRFARQMALVEKLLGIAKIVVGGVGACLSGLVVIFLWVNNTNAAIAHTSADIAKARQEMAVIVEDRKEVMKEWGKWRAEKDKADIELTQLAINQAKTTDRIYTLLDRIEARLIRE